MGGLGIPELLIILIVLLALGAIGLVLALAVLGPRGTRVETVFTRRGSGKCQAMLVLP